MGADVSSEGGRYNAARASEFERRYRQMYGEDLSREQLLEKYRMEKLKADRKRRLEEAEAAQEAENRRHKDGYNERSRRDREYSRDSRHREEDRSRRRQEDNMRIIRGEREKRTSDHQQGHESRRSRDDRRYDDSTRERRSRHRRDKSPRDRDRSRHRSSSGSSKENHRDRRKSSDKMPSSDRERDSRSHRRRERSGKKDEKERRHRSRRREEETRSSRSRSKHKKDDSDSQSDEEYVKSERQVSKTKKSTKTKDESSSKREKSKKKDYDAKIELHKSAPDLTEDREYGRGPWQRTHDFFGGYNHRPQSWVEQLSYDRNGSMPAPVMERQIIYSLPHSASLMDGIGFPLREQALAIASSPQRVHSPRQQRSHSMDMTLQETSVAPTAASPQHSSQTTSPKIPAGAVPALGPNAKPKNSKKSPKSQHNHSKSHHSSSSPSERKKRSASRGHHSPSRHEKSSHPSPNPRTKSPTKDKSFDRSTISKSHGGSKQPHSRKQKQERITAISAREDFESLLASDYGASNGLTMSNDFPSGSYAPSYPGNYRPNQEIYVDDVIIRRQPPVKQNSRDTESDVISDDERALTVGDEFSPNSFSYSSGFDIEGFCFDSDTSGAKRHTIGSHKKKQGSTKVREKTVKATSAKPVHAGQNQSPKRAGKSQALILTPVSPVSRPRSVKSRSPERVNHRDNTKIKQETHRSRGTQSPERSRRQRKQSNPRSVSTDSDIYSTSAPVQRSGNVLLKRKNKRIQHPSEDETYERIIKPSKAKWTSMERKETHDVGVGTKARKPRMKSTAVQTKKSQPQAQPIYFLKPMSSHEVFIEDSSVMSRSETDFSQSQAKSETLSQSSRISSNTDYTERSQVNNPGQNYQRTTRHHADFEESQLPPSLSSTTSFDPVPVQVVQPAMKIGVSDTIQPYSYKSSGGQVFCLTRSRQGSSPPPSLRAMTEDNQSVDDFRQNPPLMEQQHESHDYEPYPSHFEDDYAMSDTAPHSGNIQPQMDPQFDAHEVGKWVLDCYAQDQKIRSYGMQNDPTPVAATRNSTSESPTANHVRLSKQSAFEYEASFTLPTDPLTPKENQPKVIPLTQEALQNHEEHTSRYSSQSDKSETETSVDERNQNDHPANSAFLQEIKRSKKRMGRQIDRERTPEPPWKSEQYKSNLNHWNTSPSSNVVLREVCPVNDTDEETTPEPSRKSSTSSESTQPEQRFPSAPPKMISKNTREIRPSNNRPPYVNMDATQSETNADARAISLDGPVPQVKKRMSLSKIPLVNHERSQSQREPSIPESQYIRPSSATKSQQDNRQPTIMQHNEQYVNPQSSINSQGISHAPVHTRKPYAQQRSNSANTNSSSTSDHSISNPSIRSNNQGPEYARKPYEQPRPSSANTNSSIHSNRSATNRENNYGSVYTKKPFLQQRSDSATTNSSVKSNQSIPWTKKPSGNQTSSRQPYLERIAKGSTDGNMNKSSRKEPYSKAPSREISSSANATLYNAPKHEDVDRNSRKPEIIPLADSNRPNPVKKQESTDCDSDTDTALSSASSASIISPKKNLREALLSHGLYASELAESAKPQIKPEINRVSAMENSPKNYQGLKRASSVDSKSRIENEGDWRIVGGPNKTSSTVQQDPVVPTPHIVNRSSAGVPPMEEAKPRPRQSLARRHPISVEQISNSRDSRKFENLRKESSSADELTHIPSSSHSNQKHHPAYKSSDNESGSQSSVAKNPFNRMDEREVDSIVGKVPGGKPMSNSSSESDILEKLEKARQNNKKETLEERAARILGIHRRTSSDDDSSDDEDEKYVHSRHQPPPSSEPQKDLNTYLNNLLTGEAAVSPGTRQRHLEKKSVKSPLVTNSLSSNDCGPPISTNRLQNGMPTAQHLQSPEIVDDQRSQSSSSDIIDMRKGPQSENGHSAVGSVELEIPRNPGLNRRGSPSSLLDYRNNIYAETPGFHKQTSSQSSSEDDIASNRPGKKESGTYRLSQESGSSRPSRNSGRDRAKEQIAKSIGFTLHNGNSSQHPVHSDEYDIKVLSYNGERNSHQSDPRIRGEKSPDEESLENVMQSIGLDPEEAWTMSV